MKYLVQMTANEPPPNMKPQDAGGYTRQLVFPSLAKLAEWDQQGKISGGVVLGARALAFIVAAENNDEVDALIQSLPVWVMATTTVTPLVAFDARSAREEQMLRQFGV
jgi:hypothetical protein